MNHPESVASKEAGGRAAASEHASSGSKRSGDIVIFTPGRLLVLVLAVLLVLAVVLGWRSHSNQAATIDQLQLENKALRLQQGQTKGVTKAFSQIKADATAAQARLQDQVDRLNAQLQTAEAAVANSSASSKASKAAIAAMGDQLTTSQKRADALQRQLVQTKAELAAAKKTLADALKPKPADANGG